MSYILPKHTCSSVPCRGSNGTVARPLDKHAPTRRPYVSDTGLNALQSARGTTATICPLTPPPSPNAARQSSRCSAATATATATASPPLLQQQQQPQHQATLRGLYPPSTAHQSGYLKVSELHSIYYEVHGNPAGVPAVVAHGGPGAGCYPNHVRFFDPQHYRIVLLDQRGCGRSTPTGCLADNTTAALVSDLNALRRHLNIQQWVLFGGSWGVALSIAYAQAYPETVLGVVLRGVCLMRPSEIQWMYGGGAAALRPLAWRKFLEHLEVSEGGDPVLGYYKRFLNPDAAVRQAAAKAWMAWEMAVGFSNSQDLLLWNGQQWAAQPSPTAAAAAAAAGQPHVQQALPPPAPMSAAARKAAAAAQRGGLPMLQRGVVLPVEVMNVSDSSSSSTAHGNVRRRNTKKSLTDSNTLAGPVAGNFSSGSSNLVPGSRSSVQPAHTGSSGLTAAGDQVQQQQQQQQSLESARGWGLSVVGYNTQDPEVQTLIQQGLNHRGFDNSAAQALLECHYCLHSAFLLDQPLLDHIERVRHIPCIAVQGQADLVCPPATAVELSESWPEMELRLVPGAGHSMYDPAITHELVCATDRMRALMPRHQQQQRQRGGFTPAATAAAAVGRRC